MSHGVSFLTLCLILTLFITGVIYGDNSSLSSENLDRAKKALVRIKSGGGSGNGVIISKDGLILTVAHVVPTTPDVVYTHDGDVLNVEVLYRDPFFDLALLKARTKKTLPYIPLGYARKLGEKVSLIGRQIHAERTSIHHGAIRMMSVNIPKEDIPWSNKTYKRPTLENGIIHSAYCEEGYSGGALLSKRGELIGITMAYGKANKHYMTFTIQTSTYIHRLGKLVTKEGYATTNALRLKTRPTFTSYDCVCGRVDWVLKGLIDHSTLHGHEMSYINKKRESIRTTALSLYKVGTLSEQNVTRWVWKKYLSSL